MSISFGLSGTQKGYFTSAYNVLTKETKFFDLGAKVAKLVVDGLGFKEPFFVNFIDKASAVNSLCGLKKKIVDLFEKPFIVEPRRFSHNSMAQYIENFRWAKDWAGVLSTGCLLSATVVALRYGDKADTAGKLLSVAEGLGLLGAAYSLTIAGLNLTTPMIVYRGSAEKEDIEENASLSKSIVTRLGNTLDALTVCKESFGIGASLFGLGVVKIASFDSKVVKTVFSFASGFFGFAKDVIEKNFPLKAVKTNEKGEERSSDVKRDALEVALDEEASRKHLRRKIQPQVTG